MKPIKTAVAACVLSLSLLAAGGAAAAPVRAPEAGAPAVAIDGAEGWQVMRPNPAGVLVVKRMAGFAGVMMVEAPITEDMLDLVANGILSTAGAEPASRSEPITTGGLKGKIYYSRLTQNGVSGPLKLILVLPDAQHVAAVIDARFDGIDPADAKILDAMIASVRFESR